MLAIGVVFANPRGMRPRVAFHGVLAVLAITAAVICALEPVQGDGWGHFAAARQPVTWDRLVAFAKGGYVGGNPRWGQLVLLAMFDEPMIAVVATPMVVVGMVLVALTLISGRWPNPSDPRDRALVGPVIALVIASTPHFGASWFHRPYCANYLYPLLVQLTWLIPYRFALARSLARPVWLALAITPLGVLAGLGNEHTGLGLAAGAAACTYVMWRRDRRVPWWAVLGIAALVAGYIALLTAPGQLVRYGALATQHTALERIAERGILGNLRLVGSLLGWLGPMLVIIAWVARRELCGRWLGHLPRCLIAGYLAIAALMFATALAAPHVPARLLVAPATMIALALGVFVAEHDPRSAVARQLRTASLVYSAGVLGFTLATFIVAGIEGRARLGLVMGAPKGTVVCVEPYTFSSATPFWVGDDLRNKRLAARVATLFALEGITRSNCNGGAY